MSIRKENIWKELADKTAGVYTERKTWRSEKAEIDWNGLKIVFDNYTAYTTVDNHTLQKTYTRAYVRLRAPIKFRFEIYPEQILDSISKIFGAQDIKSGNTEFDKLFIIKANDKNKIIQLLNNKIVVNSIINLVNPHIQISTRSEIWGEELPEGVSELSLFIEELVSDIEKPMQILTLFKEILWVLKQ